MMVFKIFLVVSWLLVSFLTAQAFGEQGMIAGELFISDIQALNWRAQFNVDFLAHLLLLGSWVAWRHRFSPAGFVLALACVLGGGLVSFVYILLAILRAKGDMQSFLMGKPLVGEK
jgi:hypothetical protein